MRFADVLVPDAVKKQLIQTVLSRRISHAQLFYGMEGTHVLALALSAGAFSFVHGCGCLIVTMLVTQEGRGYCFFQCFFYIPYSPINRMAKANKP